MPGLQMPACDLSLNLKGNLRILNLCKSKLQFVEVETPTSATQVGVVHKRSKIVYFYKTKHTFKRLDQNKRQLKFYNIVLKIII